MQNDCKYKCGAKAEEDSTDCGGCSEVLMDQFEKLMELKTDGDA